MKKLNREISNSPIALSALMLIIVGILIFACYFGYGLGAVIGIVIGIFSGPIGMLLLEALGIIIDIFI